MKESVLLKTITEKTLIPLSMVATIISASFFIARLSERVEAHTIQITQIEAEQRRYNKHLEEIRGDLREIKGELKRIRR